MMRWKLGLDGANSMQCDLETEIAILSDIGFDGIELRDYKVADYLTRGSLRELDQRLRDAGLEPMCMSAMDLKYGQSPAERAAQLKTCELLLEAGAAVGCPQAIIVHLPPDDPSGLPGEAEVLRTVVDDVEKMCVRAEQLGMRLLYEFLGSRACPIHTVAGVQEIVRRVNRPSLGWLFDFYHFTVSDGDFEALRQADFSTLGLVHLTDVQDLGYEALAVPNSHRAFPGQGAAASDEIMKIIADKGYAGSFVIELYDTQFLSWDPAKFARTAYEYAREMLNAHSGTPA